MFSKMGMRVIAAIVAIAMLGGCAEFDGRGGVVAEVQDIVLFKAYTKSHRLFRSYMLAGVLLAAPVKVDTTMQTKQPLGVT